MNFNKYDCSFFEINTMIKKLVLALSILLIVGCDDVTKKSQKLPNTIGLPASSNLYGEIDMKVNAQKLSTLKTAYEDIKKISKTKTKGKEFWREFEEILGQLKDAGFGDIEKGDINSISFGFTIPTNPQQFDSLQPEDTVPVVIVRGNFSPKRTNEFCDAEKIDSTLISGEKSWCLESLINKLSNNKKNYTVSPDKAAWIAYGDDKTLVVGTKNSLRKSLSILKGEGGSLVPQPVNKLKEYNDWSIYVSFNCKSLIDNSIRAAKVRPGDEFATKIGVDFIKIIPHNQATFLCGSRDDDEVVAFVMSNSDTNENIKYEFSASKSVTVKILKLYTDLIQTMLNQYPGSPDSGL